MKIVKSWIFWLLYSLIPALLTLCFAWSRETMVYLYFLAIFIAVVIMWLYEKYSPKAENEF